MKEKEILDEIESKNYFYASDFNKYLEFNNNKDIILAAVRKDGEILKFASDELKNDKEVVLAAVTKNGDALEFASDNLKKDKNIVLTAVKNGIFALRYAPKEFQNDKEIVFESVKQSYLGLQYASNELKNDKDFVMKCIKEEPGILEDVSKELKNDKEVVLESVKQNGLLLKYASGSLKNDLEIAKTAISQNDKAIEYVGKKIIIKLEEDSNIPIAFKDSYDGKLYKFEDGARTFGLSLKGNINDIMEIKTKYLQSKDDKFPITDDRITITNLNNDIIQLCVEYYVPVKTTYNILKNYPNLKLATFWDIIDGHNPQLYILYSEAGTSKITKNKFIIEESAEDEYNPLLYTNILDSTKKVFKFNSSDSHTGYNKKCKISYAFPFEEDWNK